MSTWGQDYKRYPALNAILKRMHKVVKAPYVPTNLNEANWFYEYSWTSRQEAEFKCWLVTELMSRPDWRKELMRNPCKNRRACERVADEINFQWGWKRNTDIVLLVGPMTGKKEYNRKAFDKAAAKWRQTHETVINPAEHYVEGKTWAEYMKDSLNRLLTPGEVTMVAVLKGWMKSKGSCLEMDVADAMKIPAFDARTGKPMWGWTMKV